MSAVNEENVVNVVMMETIHRGGEPTRARAGVYHERLFELTLGKVMGVLAD